jgi:hypothetical protein
MKDTTRAELTGDRTRLVLDPLWLGVLVLGLEGIDPGAGATCDDDSEAGVDAAMVAMQRLTGGPGPSGGGVLRFDGTSRPPRESAKELRCAATP